MYTPTKWESVKNFFRFLFCQHKDMVTRTVKSGSDNDLKVLGEYKYCNDCKNNISGWL